MAEDEDGDWHSVLMLMRRDGSHVREVIDGPGSGVWDPSWSPDGNMLAFDADASTGSGQTI